MCKLDHHPKSSLNTPTHCAEVGRPGFEFAARQVKMFSLNAYLICKLYCKQQKGGGDVLAAGKVCFSTWVEITLTSEFVFATLVLSLPRIWPLGYQRSRALSNVKQEVRPLSSGRSGLWGAGRPSNEAQLKGISLDPSFFFSASNLW